jgi:RNA polymerase sigma-70 factor (ECF subfamily)
MTATGNNSGGGDPPDALDALLERVRAGDQAALSDLLRRYEPRLRAAARVRLGPLLRPHLESLDVVQSVHRALLPGLREGRFRPAGPDELMALAVTMIRRKVADAARRAGRRPVAEAGPGGDDGLDAVPDPRGPSADPSAEAEAADDRARLLASLYGPDRRLAELRLEGRDTAEIAAALGCDTNAVRARLSRLRRRLRDAGAEGWV